MPIKKKMVAKSVVRINYPESASIYNFLSDSDITSKTVLKEFADARKEDGIVKFSLGVDEDGDLVRLDIFNGSQIKAFVPFLVPAKYVQSIRGM